ncbi:MAG: type II toxin-antitoxin system death-on-curing family toxin [Oscillospiraceae bacterium]|nr:type II toxin-antitoxin system death-on-curing family toxin [Oscillospiraceae bacterium]
MNGLTEQQVVSAHSRMIEMTGGIDGIRDKGMLNSALNSPFQTFGGKDLYPTLLEKAAVICHSIIADHPFVDGNKRTGIHVMLIFLELNGIELQCTENELVELGLGAASGKLSYNDILTWLTEHII